MLNGPNGLSVLSPLLQDVKSDTLRVHPLETSVYSVGTLAAGNDNKLDQLLAKTMWTDYITYQDYGSRFDALFALNGV